MQKGIPATAGSKMLLNFVAPFDAEVVTLLKTADVQICGRISIGEFGAVGLFSDQWHELTVAVNSFANSDADAMLCNDYTGKISSAAAAHDMYYIHPAYGSVSRYGLIQSVVSIDQIGVLCRDVSVGFEILEIIKKQDRGDGSLCHARKTGQENRPPVMFPQPYYDIYPQIMQILCCGELANNISRYDGIKFGHRAKEYDGLNDLYTKSRTETFGETVKLASMIGAMVLSEDNYLRYYDKAMRLRRRIKESNDFTKCNVITATGEQKDNFSVLSRLCGLASLTTPISTYISNTGYEDLLEGLISNEV